MPRWKDTAIQERNWLLETVFWDLGTTAQATSDTLSIDLSQKAKPAAPREHWLLPGQPTLSGKGTSEGAKRPKGTTLPRSQDVGGVWTPMLFTIEGPLRKTNSASVGSCWSLSCPSAPVETSGNSFFFLNWDIVDLQCCVSFGCTAKWFSYTYIHIYSF